MLKVFVRVIDALLTVVAKVRPVAKAIVPAAVPLVALVVAWRETGRFDELELVIAVVGFVQALLTYFVPNRIDAQRLPVALAIEIARVVARLADGDRRVDASLAELRESVVIGDASVADTSERVRGVLARHGLHAAPLPESAYPPDSTPLPEPSNGPGEEQGDVMGGPPPHPPVGS